LIFGLFDYSYRFFRLDIFGMTQFGAVMRKLPGVIKAGTRAKSVKLVVFDIYNTIVIPDRGLPDAPIEAFSRVFENFGLNVSKSLIYRDYGNDKGVHLGRILGEESVAKQAEGLKRKFGEKGMKELMFRELEAKQCEILEDEKYSRLVPGFIGMIEDLKYMGVEHFCTTTGFNEKMQNVVLKHMKKQGFTPFLACASDTYAHPRPDPIGMRKIMEACGITCPSEVVKVGDTVADMKEATNTSPLLAAVGVKGTVPEPTLTANGAWYVINTVNELPFVINRLEQSRNTVD